MAKWPNSTEIATDQRELNPGQRMVIGGATGMAALIDALLNMVRSAVSTGLFPEPTTLGDTKVSLSEASSPYRLGISNTQRWHGVHNGNLITLDGRSAPSGGWIDDLTNAQYGLFDAAYERAAGITYYIGVLFDRYPEDAVASGGALHYKFMPHAMGVTTNPASVVDDGDGTMTIDVTGVTNFWGTAGPWASGGKRKCIVYMTNPRTAGPASRHVGEIESDGSNLTISVPHTFGQNAPSTTASDYQVFVPGLTIWRGAAPGNAWQIGTVTDGVFDYSTQRISQLPQNLGNDIEELMLRVMHPESRPGCYFGALDKTRDVADACVITTPTGFVTATLTDPGSVTGVPDDWRIYTGGVMCALFKSGGLTVSMDDTEPDGTYIVYVDSETVDGVQQAKLAITDSSDYVANHLDKLPLRQFSFTTSSNTVSSELAASLEQYRLGGLPHGLEADGLGQVAQDLIFYPDAGAGLGYYIATPRGKVLMRAGGGSGGRASLQLFMADHTTDLDPSDPTQRSMTIQAITDGNALQVHGPGGSAALGAGEYAGLELGRLSQGVGIYQLGAAAAADYQLLFARSADKSDVLMRILQDGGVQTDQVNSLRPVVKVPDLALLGAGGKLVTRSIWVNEHNVRTVVDGSDPWTFDDPTIALACWGSASAAAGDNHELYVPIPFEGTPGRASSGAGGADGAAPKLCRVRVHFEVTAGTSSDKVDGDIVEVDPTDSDPFSTGLTSKSGTTTWYYTSDGLKNVDISGSSDGDGVPVGIEMDLTKLYFVRLITEGSGGGGVVRKLRRVSPVYRKFEIG